MGESRARDSLTSTESSHWTVDRYYVMKCRLLPSALTGFAFFLNSLDIFRAFVFDVGLRVVLVLIHPSG